MTQTRNREYAGLNTIVVVEVEMERVRLGSIEKRASVVRACKSLAKSGLQGHGVVDTYGKLHPVPLSCATLRGAYYRAMRKARDA